MNPLDHFFWNWKRVALIGALIRAWRFWELEWEIPQPFPPVQKILRAPLAQLFLIRSQNFHYTFSANVIVSNSLHQKFFFFFFLYPPLNSILHTSAGNIFATFLLQQNRTLPVILHAIPLQRWLFFCSVSTPRSPIAHFKIKLTNISARSMAY